ncbi:MAG: hypothetical protein JST44_15110 [Cyanobacteria bacterium SZAS LIN-5]|nr:hypothetical protein [Cyanobacteria bacterium SZAS LIN-5]RTL37744.1 MAG: hypothetical protein EKK48_23970 [Candidatus Melainabacteria bacterium]
MLGAKLYGDVLGNYIKAGSQSCSPELLEAMAHSDVDRIRLRVAENPRASKKILELLSSDPNADVRVAVGTNPSTPATISFRLAFDEDVNVRLGLADDINTPIELLEKLTEDSNPYVCHRAQQTKSIVLSHRKHRSFGRKFLRWFKQDMNTPGLRYA